MRVEAWYSQVARIGTLEDDPRSGRIFFQYDREWLDRGINLSPLRLPLSPSIYEQQDQSFHPLPGLFWDSLPDSWGQLLLERHLQAKGVDPSRVSPLLRLSYVGSAGPGAIVYSPAQDDASQSAMECISLAQAERAARDLQRDEAVPYSDALKAVVQAGGTAGGAKPKVYASSPDESGNVLRISSHVREGEVGWLIKFSGIPINHKDSNQSGRVELAYSRMATAAGIRCPETRLFEIPAKHGERALFGARRFDREGGKRIHLHSLSGMLHVLPERAPSYEEFFRTILEVTGDYRELREGFRRLIFNIAANNCDDHGRNSAFLMRKPGQWELSPAYDITPSPGRNQAGVHCMSLAGNFQPQLEDVARLAEAHDIEEQTKEDLERIVDALTRWNEFAEECGIRNAVREKIEKNLSATRERIGEWPVGSRRRRR